MNLLFSNIVVLLIAVQISLLMINLQWFIGAVVGLVQSTNYGVGPAIKAGIEFSLIFQLKIHKLGKWGGSF